MGSRPFSTIDLNYICCALMTWTYPFIHQKNSCEGKKPYETKKKATSFKALGTCS